MAALKIWIALLLLSAPLSARSLSRYALILQDPPAVAARSVVRLRMGPEVVAAGDALRVKQEAMRAELLRRKFHITGASQLLVNAVYVAADSSQLPELTRLPGVRRVRLLPPVHALLDHAEQLVNVQAAWDILGGTSNGGLGVKIAVIDSGIDQTHAAFQDPTLPLPAGYPLCQPDDCAFTNNKVIVARSYLLQQAAGSPDNPAADSRPDDFSPRDHQGHGTAIGSIIAGVTNAGPGDTITGIAPRAYLGNYKIFGTTGVNDGASGDAVISALEDAVRDGMDIANMSFGGPALTGALDSGVACGEAPDVPCDTLAQAVENATRLGLLMVAAGGNEGGTGTAFPTLGTASSPGIAPSGIAVAATTNSHVWRMTSGGWTPTDITSFNTVAPFSSRGPALGTAAIKPELAAVGTNIFLATQNYDPSGDLYSPLRYTISQGTSFSAPMVAGAAALVKQRHPGWQPGQLKSALVNTATQDVSDRGPAPATVTAVGAGKLNAGNAVASNITVIPQTASFGVLQSVPAIQTFEVQNNGPRSLDLQLAIDARTTDANATMTLDRSSLTIASGQSARFTASLTGALPAPGSYEGFIVIQGDPVTLRIPYLYLVGDGSPVSLIPLLGGDAVGLAGHDVPDGILAFKVLDQYGLPVPNVPATFAVVLGGGQIAKADPVTDRFGVATAEAVMGNSTATNVFSAMAAGMRLQFIDTGVSQPIISDNGAVNAASFQVGPGIAPGSYISIFGSNLSLTTGAAVTPRLPLSIQNVSVSFDVPNTQLSLPGHLIYVNPTQVNVQVPWELRGRTSVQMKVSISFASGAVFTVPLADYSPGIFNYTSAGQSFAVAQDAAFAQVTVDHPAVRGQIITLYGTGFGPVNHAPPSGDPAPDASATTLRTPTVTVGGVAAKVEFSGLAPGYAGLYQINFSVPAEAPVGIQPVAISANGVAANAVLLPIQ